MKIYFVDFIAAEAGILNKQIVASVKLFDDGNTVPFISRYRKEVTGNLDEEKLFLIEKYLKQYNELEERKVTVLNTISELGKLTPELKEQIEKTCDSTLLEDLYLPYKPKRKTRASTARENGLEPLALTILEQKNIDAEQAAEKYINDVFSGTEKVLQGARDIIAEMISEDSSVRDILRRLYIREAIITVKVVKGKEEEGANYRDYYAHTEPVTRCKSHRFMAILRGEKEGFLKVKISVDDEKVLQIIRRKYIRNNSEAAEQVSLATEESYKRLLHPSMENDTTAYYKDVSGNEAIKVFSSNLRQLLMLPPLGPARILALDPGYRSGCKVVCLDDHGSLLHNQTIYPHPPQSDRVLAGKKIITLIEMYKIDAIAIGNGTASRDTENFIKSLKYKNDIKVFVVDESGASVYSASAVARKEFPDYDVTVRGAVSIGRRLIDPLAELIKIDPEAIGVGQYQHDVSSKQLKEELGNVVISCVNAVGVNVNTASEELLKYVSGLNTKTAAAFIDYRNKKGGIKSREEFKKVKGIGDAAFQQCAGFIRVPESVNPLDNTAVHPESYPVVLKMAGDLKVDTATLAGNKEIIERISPEKYINSQTGKETVNDIISELRKQGRDPRGKPKMFAFDNTIKSVADLKEGMVLPGIVTNLTNFGVFVDIGIKVNGLIHIRNYLIRSSQTLPML